MAKDQAMQIQSEINKLILKESCDREKFLKSAKSLEDHFGAAIYSSLLFTTAHLDFKEKTAKKHCLALFTHWRKMSQQMKRKVDFRVAALDYFMAIHRGIKNPMIIEIKIFKKAQMEIKVDELTQLYNYRYFMYSLNQEVKRSNRYNSPLTLVFFDVDDFKHYNDINGHHAGNKSLKMLSQILKSGVRDVDIAARFGGEEFALLLPETNKEGGMVISERIRKKIQESPFFNAELQPLKRFTISGGLATLNVDAKTASDLIKKADHALYRAKAYGKNQMSLNTDDRRIFERIRASISGRLTVATDMGDIFIVQDISEGGLLFHYHKALSVGTVMHLTLNVPGMRNQIDCKAKVRRIKELKKDKKYEIGAQISRIPQGEKKALKSFIRSTKKNKK